MPQANANEPNQGAVRCGLTVTPTLAYVAQGGTRTFDVNVLCSSGGTPTIELIWSPPLPGISVSFTANNQPAPYTSTMTVKVDASKPQGNYSLSIWSHPVGVPFPGPLNAYQNVFIIVVPPPTATALAETDWEMSNAFILPANPKQGDVVTFSATLRVMSTTTPFPQTVRIELLGSNIIDSFSVTYAGPVGSSMIVTKAKILSVPGTYTVYLYADGPPPFQYNDPNRANNQATVTFTVALGAATVTKIITTTSPSYSVTAWSLTPTVTQPVTMVTWTTFAPGFSGTFPWMLVLFLVVLSLLLLFLLPSSFFLLLFLLSSTFGAYDDIVVVVAMVVVAIIGAMKWLKPQPSGHSRQLKGDRGALMCPNCGAHLSVGQKFCRDCGTTLNWEEWGITFGKDVEGSPHFSKLSSRVAVEISSVAL